MFGGEDSSDHESADLPVGRRRVARRVLVKRDNSDQPGGAELPEEPRTARRAQMGMHRTAREASN